MDVREPVRHLVGRARDDEVLGDELAGDIERHEERDVRVPALSGPDGSLRARGAWHPDRWVRLLQRQAPRVHVAEVVVAAFPAERAGLRPALQDQIVTLLEALAV